MLFIQDSEEGRLDWQKDLHPTCTMGIENTLFFDELNPPFSNGKSSAGY